MCIHCLFALILAAIQISGYVKFCVFILAPVFYFQNCIFVTY